MGDEVTMKDVETLIRRCNSLSKKVESNAEAASQLKELQNAKRAIEKQVVLTTGPEVVARAKACIAKQLLAQMVYVFAWNDELKDKNGGRSIAAYLPNVSPELLSGLGGSMNSSVQKMPAYYFDQPIWKAVPKSTRKDEQPTGNHLVLGAYIQLKYIKTSCALEVTSTYKFGDPGKKPTKGKGKGRGKGRGKASRNQQGGTEEYVEEDFVETADAEEEPIAGAKLVD